MPATNAQRLLLLEEIQGDVPNIGSRKISESLYEAEIGLLRPHSGAPQNQVRCQQRLCCLSTTAGDMADAGQVIRLSWSRK